MTKIWPALAALGQFRFLGVAVAAFVTVTAVLLLPLFPFHCLVRGAINELASCGSEFFLKEARGGKQRAEPRFLLAGGNKSGEHPQKRPQIFQDESSAGGACLDDLSDGCVLLVL